MSDTTGFLRQHCYRVKFYITEHRRGERPSYFNEDEWEQLDLTGEEVERDVLATGVLDAIEHAEVTMQPSRMGDITWEVTAVIELGRPENAPYVKDKNYKPETHG